MRPSFSIDDKRGDLRSSWSRDLYDDCCWEVDVLDPVALREGVEPIIMEWLHLAEWTRYVEAERVEQGSIRACVSVWPKLTGTRP